MALKWFRKKKSEKPDKNVTEAALPPDGQEDEGDLPTSADAPVETEDPAPAREEIEAPEDEPPPAPVPETQPAPTGKGLFARLKSGLAKTRRILTTDIEDLFGGQREIDDDFLDDLEELLITSDIGVRTAMDLMDAIRRRASKISGPDALKEVLKEEIRALLDEATASAPPVPATKPHVIMVVGVNGVGKTTTIGKLAARATAEGQSVLIAAADTFRAAAIEQLGIWAERAKADLVKHKENSDPAAVVFDGIEAALARGSDLVFIDTAGRLHTKVNLMEELKKIRRTIAKKIPDAPHEILLVLDATTGQNAVSQAKLFHEAIGVTGLALTKLDGTAKGGIVVSISRELNIPLKHIGVGESVEDLQTFDARQFVDALF